MVRIILSGCNGKMGRVITGCVANRADCRIVAGFDINTERHADFPVYANPSNCQVEADVIIDFRTPARLTACCPTRTSTLPAVIATTACLTSKSRKSIAFKSVADFLQRQYVNRH